MAESDIIAKFISHDVVEDQKEELVFPAGEFTLGRNDFKVLDPQVSRKQFVLFVNPWTTYIRPVGLNLMWIKRSNGEHFVLEKDRAYLLFHEDVLTLHGKKHAFKYINVAMSNRGESFIKKVEEEKTASPVAAS